MPGVVHHGPDPAAIAVCRDVLEESHAEGVVLHGSRGWDEQSDLNLIVIHGAAADSGRPAEQWHGIGSVTIGTPSMNNTAWSPGLRS